MEVLALNVHLKYGQALCYKEEREGYLEQRK